jgi:molybdenum cofactor cytidylyltransferase
MSRSSRQPRILAVIPAAGQGRRFGSPKQLHVVRGKLLLQWVIEAIVDGPVDATVLVTQSVIWDKLPQVVENRVIPAFNNDAASTMIDSIRIGTDRLVEWTTVAPDDGILVCPGDMLHVSSADVQRCVGCYVSAQGSLTKNNMVIAEYASRRGHPLIFPASMLDIVHSARCDQGLNQLLGQYPERIRYVTCESAGVVEDVDTPEDLPSEPHA